MLGIEIKKKQKSPFSLTRGIFHQFGLKKQIQPKQQVVKHWLGDKDTTCGCYVKPL